MEILTPEQMDERTGANRRCAKCGEMMRHKNHDLSNPDNHAHQPLRPDTRDAIINRIIEQALIRDAAGVSEVAKELEDAARREERERWKPHAKHLHECCGPLSGCIACKAAVRGVDKALCALTEEKP